MEPGKTSFFQALGVPTKIARGTIEITTDLKLVEAGNKVGASEATLLNMLNISPFTYGMGIAQVYDQGQVFPPSILDIDEAQILSSFLDAVKIIASISLAANYPTLASVSHSLINAYKNAVAVALCTDYSWELIDELKDRIANPDSYASAGPSAGPAVTAPDEDKPAAGDDDKEDEESDEGMLITKPPYFPLTPAANPLQVDSRVCSGTIKNNREHKPEFKFPRKTTLFTLPIVFLVQVIY